MNFLLNFPVFKTDAFKKGLLSIKTTVAMCKYVHKWAFSVSGTLYIFLIILTLVTSMSPMVMNYLNGVVIDGLVKAINVSNPTFLLRAFFWFVLYYVVTTLLSSVSNYVSGMLDMILAGDVILKFQKGLARLDIGHHNDPAFNDKCQKAIDQYQFSPTNLYSTTLYLVSSIVIAVSNLIIIYALSPLVAIIVFVGSVPQFISDLIFSEQRYGIFKSKSEDRRSFWQTTDYFEDEKSLAELKIYQTKNFLIRLMTRIYNKYFLLEKKTEKKRLLVGGFLDIITVVVYAIVIWLLLQKTLGHVISVGQFTFYLATLRTLDGSFSNLLNRMSRIYERSLYVKDVKDILEAEPYIINGKSELILKDAPMIEFKNVSFKYPNTNKYVLKDFNLKIDKDEDVAIVGENGVGKTTFIRLLCRFYDVSEGEILINGINIKELNINSFYRYVSLLLQEYSKYHYDVKTNIGLGNVKNIDDINLIKKYARMSGADKFINEYDNKYDQVLSKKYKGGIDPSTGQWQKIAIAKALFKEPKVLILDEPTSAIDPKSEAEIFNKLFKYAQNKTVLIISHRFSTVRNAKKIIVLDKGKIVEQGSHEELMKLNKGIYKNAFNIQKKGYE